MGCISFGRLQLPPGARPLASTRKVGKDLEKSTLSGTATQADVVGGSGSFTGSGVCVPRNY